MTSPTINNLYPVANATTSSRVFVDVFLPRDPTSHDVNYQLQQKWLNTVTDKIWMLVSFTPTSSTLLANWIQITGSVGTEELEGNTGGPVGPNGSGIIFTIGDGIGITVAGNPGTNTLTWSLAGGGIATEKFEVDSATFPGTNPVTPTVAGLITVTGGQVAAGTTGNVIQTNSLAANTYTIQVQRSQAVASSTMADNGVSHFNSAQFTVDSNGFVSATGTIPLSFVEDSGTAVPSGGVLNVKGSGPISTSGSGNTVTIATTTGSTAFFAYPSMNFDETLGAGVTTITFDSTDFNVGSAYSTGTGLFTVPATGIYSFQCCINLSNNSETANTPSFYFIRNGSELYRFTEMNFSTSAPQLLEGYSGALTLSLTASDTIGLALGDNALGGGPFTFTVRGRITGPPIINLNYFSGFRVA